MSALVETFDALDAAEEHRRRMLAESDVLLGRIEELRLAEWTTCPPDLADAVRSLLIRLGRVPADRPRSIRAAHHLVFAVQARLMAANPRHPRPRALPGRPTGLSRLTVLRPGGAAWKFLALPPPPPQAHAAEWGRLIQLTVGRALDRWACAQDQAVRAARAGENRVAAAQAVHRSRAAWRNYWELRCEADRILKRAGASGREGQPAACRRRRGRPPPRPAAAKPTARSDRPYNRADAAGRHRGRPLGTDAGGRPAQPARAVHGRPWHRRPGRAPAPLDR